MYVELGVFCSCDMMFLLMIYYVIYQLKLLPVWLDQEECLCWPEPKAELVQRRFGKLGQRILSSKEGPTLLLDWNSQPTT